LIDPAKNIFAVHDVDKNGNAVFVKPNVFRAALPELIANQTPLILVTEACSGAHYRARLFSQHSYDVKMMAQKFV